MSIELMQVIDWSPSMGEVVSYVEAFSTGPQYLELTPVTEKEGK